MEIEAQARKLYFANAGQIKSVNACSLATVSSCVGVQDDRQRYTLGAELCLRRLGEW